MTAHVLVIGGGVAGCAAAASAARAGARVTLVNRSVGATALSSGAITLDGIDRWPGGADALPDVLTVLRSLVRLEGDPADRRTYLTSAGGVVGAQLVMPHHAAGALVNLGSRRVLCVGFSGLCGWNAGSIARHLVARGIRAEGTTIRIEGLARDWDLSAFAIARFLDDTAAAARLAASIVTEAGKGSWDVVALPPVLGLSRWRETGMQLDRILGRPWFETLSAVPSVPGFRLLQDIQASLRAAGVTLLHADAKRASIAGRRIVGIDAIAGEVTHHLEPDTVVLATGRFVGGGLVLGDGVVESLLGLPVVPGAGVAAEDRVMSAGVEVGGDMRPRDAGGRSVVTNLLVAGSMLRGVDHASGGAGIGLAAATGVRAGWLAAAAEEASTTREPPDRIVKAIPRAGMEGCLGCEACASVCPVLEQSTIDGPWYPGPRSVGNLGRSGPTADVAAEPLSLCTLCGACSIVCPAGGRNQEIVTALRADIVARRPETMPEAWRAVPRVLAEAGNVYGTSLPPMDGPRRTDAEIAFFPGCTLLYFERESGAHTVRLLESLGVPMSIVDGVCCGGPLDVLGLDPLVDAVEKNREAVRATGASVVVAACPRCAHMLSKDLGIEGVRIEHALETVARLLPGSRVLETLRAKLGGRSVTFHDPCEVGRYLGRYGEARAVMGIVGLKVVEMERSMERSECCGAGGGLRSVNPKLSREISRHRVSEAMETGASSLLTECPSCVHNLRTGRRRKQSIVVEDLTAFLGEAV